MKLYDEEIDSWMRLIEAETVPECFPVLSEEEQWPSDTVQRLIFQRDTAYELGGGSLPAISGTAYTTREKFTDEILLVGDDLPDIKEDRPYARLTILNVNDSGWKDQKQTYRALEKMEYTRFHLHPEGFMIRISTSAGREPVRVSRQALKNGLNIQKIGSLFIRAYRQHPNVIGAKIIFITEKDFPYGKLEESVRKLDRLTGSMNEMMAKLVMDCHSCNLKDVCDEVEELRVMHKKRLR